jgi:hypothetical protein
MHNRTLLAAIATAAVVAIASPSASHAQVPQTSKGEVAIKPNFGSLISAINSSAAHNDKLKAMTEVTAANVTLVNVEELLQGNNVEALNAAITKNEADVKALRSTLSAPALAVVTTALSENKPTALTADDVVATEVLADGKVVVYYWKKAA